MKIIAAVVACVVADANWGTTTAPRMPRMTTTIRMSTRVKARRMMESSKGVVPVNEAGLVR